MVILHTFLQPGYYNLSIPNPGILYQIRVSANLKLMR